jgi:hypothetical protein
MLSRKSGQIALERQATRSQNLKLFLPRAARSNLNVQRDPSGASRDGSTKMCLKPCNIVPQAMRLRRETAEHPFGTLKIRTGAAHVLEVT